MGGNCELLGFEAYYVHWDIWPWWYFHQGSIRGNCAFQDVCTPSLSPLPPNLNKPKIMPNLFWIYTHVPTITLPKFANKSDNEYFFLSWRRKWSSCHKQIHVMTQVAKSSNKFLRTGDIWNILNNVKNLGMATRI